VNRLKAIIPGAIFIMACTSCTNLKNPKPPSVSQNNEFENRKILPVCQSEQGPANSGMDQKANLKNQIISQRYVKVSPWETDGISIDLSGKGASGEKTIVALVRSLLNRDKIPIHKCLRETVYRISERTDSIFTLNLTLDSEVRKFKMHLSDKKFEGDGLESCIKKVVNFWYVANVGQGHFYEVKYPFLLCQLATL
jgi:hypothetical protein